MNEIGNSQKTNLTGGTFTGKTNALWHVLLKAKSDFRNAPE